MTETVRGCHGRRGKKRRRRQLCVGTEALPASGLSGLMDGGAARKSESSGARTGWGDGVGV